MATATFIEFTGHARLGRRTKHLTRRLSADDVAIIDHTDLDRVSAEELLESGVRVVVNVATSASGRYPNPGPLLLVRGGVRLIDAPGAALFDEVADGELLTVRGSSVFRNGTCVAQGRALHERERPGVRVAAARRGRDVDDDADTRLEQLLGGDAVEVGVVDNRDVVGREPPRQVLGTAAEAGVAGELDEGARRHRP